MHCRRDHDSSSVTGIWDNEEALDTRLDLMRSHLCMAERDEGNPATHSNAPACTVSPQLGPVRPSLHVPACLLVRMELFRVTQCCSAYVCTCPTPTDTWSTDATAECRACSAADDSHDAKTGAFAKQLNGQSCSFRSSGVPQYELIQIKRRPPKVAEQRCLARWRGRMSKTLVLFDVDGTLTVPRQVRK